MVHAMLVYPDGYMTCMRFIPSSYRGPSPRAIRKSAEALDCSSASDRRLCLKDTGSGRSYCIGSRLRFNHASQIRKLGGPSKILYMIKRYAGKRPARNRLKTSFQNMFCCSSGRQPVIY